VGIQLRSDGRPGAGAFRTGGRHGKHDEHDGSADFAVWEYAGSLGTGSLAHQSDLEPDLTDCADGSNSAAAMKKVRAVADLFGLRVGRPFLFYD